MSLRERLVALADEREGCASPISRGIALAAARMALEDAARICDEYPKRDPAEDGNGYWAADECARSIMRALRDGLE